MGHLKDGFAGLCTISGADDYLNIQDVPGFSSFAALTNGEVIECGVRPTIGFGEVGKYTKQTSGGLPKLARTRVFRQIDRSANPVNWDTNTPVLIHSGLAADDVATLTGINVYEADQRYRGNKVVLSADDQTYLYSPANGQVNLVLANALALLLSRGAGGLSILNLLWSDAGAGAGPALRLDRHSTGPGAGHLLAYVPFSGRDNAGATVDYGQLYARILSAAAGAALGEVGIKALVGASLVEALLIGGSLIKAYAGIISANNGITVGKSGLGLGNYGLELLSNGQIAATTNNLDPLNVNRRGGDGNILAVYRDDTFVRAIRIDAGVLSFSGALSTHPTKLQGHRQDETHPVGTVLCAVDELLDDGADIHPLTRVSTQAADPCVYGVWWRREKETGYVLAGGRGSGLIRAVGPVAHGNLLETSEIPGVARAQRRRGRPDRVVRASTVAKAWGSVPADQERTIPCALLAS